MASSSYSASSGVRKNLLDREVTPMGERVPLSALPPCKVIMNPQRVPLRPHLTIYKLLLFQWLQLCLLFPGKEKTLIPSLQIQGPQGL